VSGIDWQIEAEAAIDAVIAAHTRCDALIETLSAALAVAHRQRVEIDRQSKTIVRLRDELRQRPIATRAA
jgi:hypothetical protein